MRQLRQRIPDQPYTADLLLPELQGGSTQQETLQAREGQKGTKWQKKRKGILGRSDIPLVQRLRMQRQFEIAYNREQAAKAAMFCTSVALHEVEGIGYKRIMRFAQRFKEVDREFYEDPEVGMAHAKTRMEQFGMPISGELFTVQRENRRAEEMENYALQAAQVALICGAIAMNDVFGFAGERQMRVSKRANELTDRYAMEGMGFLLAEMEKIGFLIVDGEVRGYLDDEGNAVTPKKARREGFGD